MIWNNFIFKMLTNTVVTICNLEISRTLHLHPSKTNMTLETPDFSVGNTSTHSWWIFQRSSCSFSGGGFQLYPHPHPYRSSGEIESKAERSCFRMPARLDFWGNLWPTYRLENYGNILNPKSWRFGSNDFPLKTGWFLGFQSLIFRGVLVLPAESLQLSKTLLNKLYN